jgi:peptidoglycan-associated lipoprotein
MSRFFIAGIAGLFLASCTPTAATKPEAQSSLPSGSLQGAPGSKGDQSARQQTTASSLDAHRQGKAPEAGPLKEIYFAFDQHELRTDARATLKANAEWLKTNSSQRIEIEGHCDERGTSEYNLALGAKRAQAAKDYLLSLGISPQRVSTISYGDELAVCREQTEECYQMNRRDRFVVTKTGPTF